MKLRIALFAVIFRLTIAGAALADELAQFKSAAKRSDGVLIQAQMASGKAAQLSIQFYSPSVVRLHLGIPAVKQAPSPMLDGAQPVALDFTLEDTANRLIIKNKRIVLHLQKQPARVAFLTAAGDTLLAESAENGMQSRSGRVMTFFDLHPQDHFFGFGEKFGKLDKRGTRVECRNYDAGDSYGDSTYMNTPFFMNPRGYGILFHTTWRTEYHLGDVSPDWFSMAADGGDLDYFFIYGPKLKRILAAYTDLTGHMPLPPKWALGLWHGTYTGGHKGKAGFGQEEFLHIARTFRKKKIPIDVLRIDSNWDDLVGSDYLWHKSYPEPVVMIEAITRMGYKMSLHDRPIPYGILRKYPLRMGWLVPPQQEYLDFTIPEAAAWWWHRHEVLMDMGVDAFKPDIGEEIPEEAQFANGKSGAEMRNLYARLYVKTVFEGQKVYTGKRSVVFARSGYAGSQKYPLIWGGDQHYCRWDQLPPLIRAGQCIGLSGIPLWSQDIGGIGTQKGIIPPADLYVRWAQFGFFNGVPQTFGRPWREPWKYDPEAYYGIDVLQIFRKYDNLRYRLLPYIYSLVWEAHQTGLPLMRAMVLEFQGDPEAWKHDLQYMFGPAFLVAPVYEPSDERRVYLPAGVWFDYWTGQKYEGPREIRMKTRVDVLPLFVRAGAIIPMGPVMQYTGEKPLEPLTFDIYPGDSSEFLLYNDDGETYAYEKGSYRIVRIACERKEKKVRISFAKPEGTFQNKETRTVLLQVHQEKPETVILDGRKMAYQKDEAMWQRAWRGWRYDGAQKLVLIKMPYERMTRGMTVILEK